MIGYIAKVYRRENHKIIMGKVEIVLNPLHMSGGDGPNSYSKNSHLQVYFQTFFFIFLFIFSSHVFFFFSYFILSSFSSVSISDIKQYNFLAVKKRCGYGIVKKK